MYTKNAEGTEEVDAFHIALTFPSENHRELAVDDTGRVPVNELWEGYRHETSRPSESKFK